VVHKYVVLCFISVKVITKYRTITVSGIKHIEVVYEKKNTYTSSIMLTSLYYWPLTSQSRCEFLMLSVFKISFPTSTACCLISIRIDLSDIGNVYSKNTERSQCLFFHN